jgi:hypothetical protein
LMSKLSNQTTMIDYGYDWYIYIYIYIYRIDDVYEWVDQRSLSLSLSLSLFMMMMLGISYYKIWDVCKCM